MATAIERIVEAYVTLGNRGALDDLLAHRQRLLNDMNGRSGYDFRRALDEIGAEVKAVQAGLKRLAAPRVVGPIVVADTVEAEAA